MDGRVVLLIVVGVALVAMIVVVGKLCTAVQGSFVIATLQSPQPFDTDSDGTVDECVGGSVCAVNGSVCEDHWWPFDDCICTTKALTPPQLGRCVAVCSK